MSAWYWLLWAALTVANGSAYFATRHNIQRSTDLLEQARAESREP